MSVAELELAEATAPAEPRPRPRRHIHIEPPTSPSQLLLAPTWRFFTVASAFLALAIAAVVSGGWLLRKVDEPIERFVIDHRTEWLDVVFRRISYFGSTIVVLIGGAVLAILAWRKCRVVATLVITATLTRPLLEFTLKRLVGRDRPTLARMVDGVGYSFPSGHPMAAATLWLMVPVVLSLYTHSRRVFAISSIAAVVAVGMIGSSRVYLGVHWASDVIAGILAAAMLLTGLDLAFRWAHAERHCGGVRIISNADVSHAQ